MARLKAIIPDWGEGWAVFVGEEAVEGVTAFNVDVANGEDSLVTVTFLAASVDIYQTHRQAPEAQSH